MSYQELANISTHDFHDKSILLVGAGTIASQYAKALDSMGITDVTVVSNAEEKVNKLCSEFNFKSSSGGFEKNLPNISEKDLVIIATPIHLLMSCLDSAIDSGQNNILVEKPGSLYSDQLITATQKYGSKKIRIGYNRLLYPNLHLLKELVKKEGGITSCTFTFTEWVHKINFEKYTDDVYKRWGIANPLHVISIVVDLIGMPKEISPYQYGSLPWHPSGSIFVGSGLSQNDIPFSYHADWNSNGRWGIEVMTKENRYKLVPLEELHVSPKGTINSEKISFQKAFPDVKQGLAEEITVMLDEKLNKKIDLPTLEDAAELNKLAEKIFGYK